MEVSGIWYLVDPPEAPTQPEGVPKNAGLPTATRRLTRSRQGGSKRAAHARTLRHQGLTPAVVSGWGGGGGSAGSGAVLGARGSVGGLRLGGAWQGTTGSMECHCSTPCPNMFPQNSAPENSLLVAGRCPWGNFVAVWEPWGGSACGRSGGRVPAEFCFRCKSATGRGWSAGSSPLGRRRCRPGWPLCRMVRGAGRLNVHAQAVRWNIGHSGQSCTFRGAPMARPTESPLGRSCRISGS